MTDQSLERTGERPVGGIPDRLKDLKLFLIAGEHSGDALGGRMMAAINQRMRGRVRYLGVGGLEMQRSGLISQFPLEEVAVMGLTSILPRLPRLLARVYGTVNAAIASEPDAVVIIDSPEFTHPIAKRIRRRRPDLPIIDYVSPSVWAWRPGRAAKMRRYIDHVMALLPFEPGAHQRLGGPACTYVGHPLVERLDWLRALDPTPLALRLQLDSGRPVLVVLPGSRPSEVSRLLPVFRAAVDLVAAWDGPPNILIPAVASVRGLIESGISDWSLKPRMIEGDDDRFRAFKLAKAALAASGTVTLELALSGTPAVVAYCVDAITARLRVLMTVPSVVLANLVAEDNVYPEFLQEDCTPVKLARALSPLMSATEPRRIQLEKLGPIPSLMAVPGAPPSVRAAEIVLNYAFSGRANA